MKNLDRFYNFSLKSDIGTLQELVDEWVKENGGYWEPFAMLASIIEELGEVAREINHLEKIKIKKISEEKKDLGVELGDIIFSIFCVANYYKIDLAKSFKETMKKYTRRDQNRFSN
ncbi:MAG: MazG nucleotide pyrophosphohydrolase domain-containing protein [Promethearchaeota archaeon]